MKQSGKVALGTVISFCCLLIAFRSAPFHEVWALLTSIPASTVAAWLVLGSSGLLLRSVRWRILLQASTPLPLAVTFAVNSARQLGNAVLPARLGDVFRGMNLGRAGVSNSFALATVLVERVLDTGFLVFVSAIALGSFQSMPVWLNRASRLLGAAALGGLAISALLPRLEAQILSLVQSSAPERWRGRLTHVAGQFLLGLRSLQHPGRITLFLAATTLIWALDGAGIAVLARGLSVMLSPPVTALLLASVALSTAVPAGNAGVYQMVTVAVLGPFGVARPQALALAILLQVLIIGNLLVWGLGSLVYLSYRDPDRPQASRIQREKARLLFASAAAPARSPSALRAFARLR